MSERTAMTASIDPTDVQGWDHPGYQQCRKDRRELSDVVIERGNRIAALEADNAALRGFVAAYDVIADNLLDAFPDDNFIVGIIPAMRDRLVSDHGLPLPGAGEGA